MLLPALVLAGACMGIQDGRLGTLAVKLSFDAAWASPRSLMREEGGKKSLTPTEAWSPTKFAISGSGPGGAEFSLESGDIDVETKLVPGDWTIGVRAFSAGNKEVASGTSTCLLLPGRTTAASIVLYPLEGEGDLSITIAKNLAVPAGGRIAGGLVYKGLPGHPAPAVQTTVAIDVPSEQTIISFEGIEAGHYSIGLRLLASDGSVSGGCVDTAMVMSGFLTAGTCAIEMGMPVANLSALLYPSSPLEPPLVSAEHDFSEAHGFMPLAAPRYAAEAGEEVERTWYSNGEEAGKAVELIGNRGILPEGTVAYPQDRPLSRLSLVRSDIVEESRSTFRAGSAGVTLKAGAGNDRGGYGWRASYDYASALSPSLHETTEANNIGAGNSYIVKAIAASPSGLIAISGLDDEGALHAFAAGYGAELDPATAGPGSLLPIDASWIRLWRDKVKIGSSVKTADRLAVSDDGRFIASASSLSNWLRLCSLDIGGKLLDSFVVTPGENIRAICFSKDGRKLYAAANTGGTIYAFDVSEGGMVPTSSLKLSATNEALSLQDMRVTSSGGIVVTAKDMSRLYVLSDEGTLREEAVVQGASGGVDPYHPTSLAVSGSGDSFHVLCDGEKILSYGRATSLSPYTLTASFLLPAEAEGSTVIASGTTLGGNEEILFAAGGDNVEFFEIDGAGSLLNNYPLSPTPGDPAGISTASGLCYIRGAFILAGGSSGIVAVFGAD